MCWGHKDALKLDEIHYGIFGERNLCIEYTSVLVLTFGCFASLFVVVNRHLSIHGALTSASYSSGIFRYSCKAARKSNL